jgi:hypothetical protein
MAAASRSYARRSQSLTVRDRPLNRGRVFSSLRRLTSPKQITNIALDFLVRQRYGIVHTNHDIVMDQVIRHVVANEESYHE